MKDVLTIDPTKRAHMQRNLKKRKAAGNKLSLLKRLNRYILKTLGQNQSYSYHHLNSVEALSETALGKKDERFRKGNYFIV